MKLTWWAFSSMHVSEGPAIVLELNMSIQQARVVWVALKAFIYAI